MSKETKELEPLLEELPKKEKPDKELPAELMEKIAQEKPLQESEEPKEEKQGFWYHFKNTWLAKYQDKMKKNGLKVPLSTWFALVIGGSIALSIVSFFIFQVIGIDNPVFMAIIVFLVGIDLTAGYPIYLEMRRLDELEKALPDALKQIADTLQAGGTYAFALRELMESDFGPLNKEIETVLRKLDEGENMETSLKTLSNNNDSKLIKRSVTIIIDALKTGAGLSEVLDQISEDIRELRRIGLERKSRTIMGVLLMVAAGAVVAPALFGINSSVLDFMINTVVRTGIGTPETVATAFTMQSFILFVLVFYLFVELIATSVMMALMRDGKASKSIIYAPVLLLVGYMIYYGTRLMAAATILKGT
ncbi:type II secretion system F family protein [Candidatus Micrarchaeota archaeon]|nr:type II secretion system F family protein [Candidatus Micrarchaeota archaeon]MBU1929990.1 type II secretion system F family protein [Candidatus Micrarchaeota archaeon]